MQFPSMPKTQFPKTWRPKASSLTRSTESVKEEETKDEKKSTTPMAVLSRAISAPSFTQAPKRRQPSQARPPPTLLGTSDIVKSVEVVLDVEQALPKTLRGYNWKLLYASQQHGSNFGTFFARCASDSQTLLFVENSQGAIFGFFATAAYKPSTEYYGTGECFLFALQPPNDELELLTTAFGGDDRVPVVRPLASQRHRSSEDDDDMDVDSWPKDPEDDDDEDDSPAVVTTTSTIPKPTRHSVRGAVVDVVRSEDPETMFTKPRLQTYPWTGENSYFMMCTDHSVAMGGGGEWGLFLDDHFARGATGRSDTYGNKPLCQQTEFDIVNLEVWGFTTAATLEDDAAKIAAAAQAPPTRVRARPLLSTNFSSR